MELKPGHPPPALLPAPLSLFLLLGLGICCRLESRWPESGKWWEGQMPPDVSLGEMVVGVLGSLLSLSRHSLQLSLLA